jgi:V/A-type H+-transporting ATPase subunit K
MKYNMNYSKRWLGALFTLLLLVTTATVAMAAAETVSAAESETVAEEGHGETPTTRGPYDAFAAALAIGVAALATSLAQTRIGTAGIGAIADNPKRLGAVIMLIAIPETVAILGFVVAYLILT